MSPNLRGYFALPLVASLGCQAPWDPLVGCAEFDACGTSTSGGTGEVPPTTGDGVHTVTGDGAGSTGPSDGSTTSSGSTDDEPDGMTDEALAPPSIGPHAITPDYTTVNALLAVTATADAEGVRMQIDGGPPIELEQVAPGEFAGAIEAFTALPPGDGQHTATLTPWRGVIEGEAVEAPYVIALPPPGFERHWSVSGPSGYVAAVDVLPDGRPVEFGTVFENDEPRCYLKLRNLDGTPVESLTVLPDIYCRATDLTIDRETGQLHVLVDRKGGNGVVWWVGQISAWGKASLNVGTGAVGDAALALARHPDMLAVCGSRTNITNDGRDALAVLLRPGEQAEARLFDYQPTMEAHKFAETARDCKFAGDTLVLVGEAYGLYSMVDEVKRDRMAVIEADVMTDDEPQWTIAGPGPNVQSRALALDVDDVDRFHIAMYTCDDDCVPDGEVRVYEPGGILVSQVQLGPLGSLWLGPHDIAWSPAGYAVVAFGELQGQDYVFKAQAVAPNKPAPLWTFTPKDQQGGQVGLAAAIGPYGEVYVGGVSDDRPAFAVVGG
jgi:hypothetical protein